MKRLSKVKFLKKLSEINPSPFPQIETLGDIRYLFGSKEWIESFTSTFDPHGFVIVDLDENDFQHTKYLGLQTSKEDQKILEPIGTPYNDCNFIWPNTLRKKYFTIDGFQELQNKGYKVNIDLLFNKKEIEYLNKLSESSNKKFKIEKSDMPYVVNEYKQDDVVGKKYSKRLLIKIIKYLAKEKLELKMIEGSNPDFNKSLKRLLRHRKENFILNNKEDTASAFSIKFDKFMATLTDKDSIKSRCCIFELSLDNRYAASRLYFYEHSYFLTYLASYNKKLSKLSPGLILIYLTDKYLVNKHKSVTIDYTRGDEPYKYEVGGKNITLNRLY